jgi:hypothetical protein
MILSDRVSGKLSVWGILLVGCIAAVTLPSLSMAQQSSEGESTSDKTKQLLDSSDTTSSTGGFVFQGQNHGLPMRPVGPISDNTLEPRSNAARIGVRQFFPACQNC